MRIFQNKRPLRKFAAISTESHDKDAIEEPQSTESGGEVDATESNNDSGTHSATSRNEKRQATSNPSAAESLFSLINLLIIGAVLIYPLGDSYLTGSTSSIGASTAVTSVDLFETLSWAARAILQIIFDFRPDYFFHARFAVIGLLIFAFSFVFTRLFAVRAIIFLISLVFIYSGAAHLGTKAGRHNTESYYCEASERSVRPRPVSKLIFEPEFAKANEGTLRTLETAMDAHDLFHLTGITEVTIFVDRKKRNGSCEIPFDSIRFLNSVVQEIDY